ncbi:hypothetical protein [Agromyces seonyuensis]|uniref:Uncharacterized protein n=1 Tax=Agromyces seonyuensis TaxID=2662446 RepID=A0A6I4P775_9MICO|nr:hypothetical protein [Agromyces seonyuensis]MWB99624.1 hypothetical protein [Agromyces seonyuensis]
MNTRTRRVALIGTAAVFALALAGCTATDVDASRLAAALQAADVTPPPTVEPDGSGELDGVYETELTAAEAGSSGFAALQRALAAGSGTMTLELELANGSWTLTTDRGDGESTTSPGTFAVDGDELSLATEAGRVLGAFDVAQDGDSLVLTPTGSESSTAMQLIGAQPWTESDEAPAAFVEDDLSPMSGS